MARRVPLGLVTDQFPIYETDGYTKKSGETTFTITVWKDGVVSAVVATIAEIGVSGEYKVSFTPDSVGFWVVEVLIDYNKDLFVGEYDVGLSEDAEALFNAAYDDGTTTLYMEAWLDRFGQSIAAANLVSCQVDVYEQDGSLLLTASSASPRANGRFSLTSSTVLVDNRPYNVTVTIVDNLGSITTFHAWSTTQS